MSQATQQSLVPRKGQSDITQITQNGVMEGVAISREIAAIQGKIFMAKQFPRNVDQAIRDIKAACSRPGLASVAVYSYPKGNQQVEGASIRLARTLAQSWGNMDYGIRELEQNDGESKVEAYAWDLETNTSESRTFTVPHMLHTKNGDRKLTDPRDIYETVANSGARRLRACILSIIPDDIVDMAVEECSKTMVANTKSDEKTVTALVDSFSQYNVNPKMIEARIGRKLSAITAMQVSDLRKVYMSLRDGIGTVDKFFDTSIAPEQESLAGKNSPNPEQQQASDDPFSGGGL